MLPYRVWSEVDWLALRICNGLNGVLRNVKTSLKNHVLRNRRALNVDDHSLWICSENDWNNCIQRDSWRNSRLMNIYFVIRSTRLSLNLSQNLSLFDIERIASQVEPRDQGLEITNSCHYQLEYSRKPKVLVLVYQLQFLILFLLVLFLTT